MNFSLLLLIFLYSVVGQKVIKIPLVRHKSILEKLLEQNTHPKHLKKIFGAYSKIQEDVKTTVPPTADPVKIYKVLQSQFYVEVLIGNPGQKFKMALDTAEETSWVPSVLCSPFVYPPCALKNKYDSTKSTSYKSLGQNFTILTDKGTMFGNLAQEKFHIGYLTVSNQTFVEVEGMSLIQLMYSKYDGVLGLSFDQNPHDNNYPFILNLLKQWRTIKPIFSIYFNRDETTAKGGTLFIGGSEKKHYNGSFIYLPVKASPFWSFSMDKISIDYILPYRNTTAEVCSSGCEAYPSSGDVLIRGPKNDIRTINRLLSANYVPYLNRYEVSCDSILKLPTVTFYFKGKPFPLKGKHYTQKLSYGPLTICLSAFTELQGGGDHLWGLGVSFMAQYYTEFDLLNKRVGLVPTRSSL